MLTADEACVGYRVNSSYAFFHYQDYRPEVVMTDAPAEGHLVTYWLNDHRSPLHLEVQLCFDARDESGDFVVKVVAAHDGWPGQPRTSVRDLTLSRLSVPEWHDLLLAQALADFSGYFPELSVD